jgi:hypothetical protein
MKTNTTLVGNGPARTFRDLAFQRALLAVILAAFVGLPSLVGFAGAAPPSGWQLAAPIEAHDGNSFFEDVAVDAGGNAMAVWSQQGSTWSNRYTAGLGWGTPTLVETDDAGFSFRPHVGVDSSGHAIAVWEQVVTGQTSDKIFASRYSVESGWAPATMLSTTASSWAQYSHVAVEPSGRAAAAWEQQDSLGINAWASLYFPASGWTPPSRLDPADHQEAVEPQVAMDGSGNAVASWEQYNGSGDHAWANIYTDAGGWGGAVLLDQGNPGNGYTPQAAFDANGNAVAVWYRDDGAPSSVWANTYSPKYGWQPPTLIERSSASNAYAPQVAVDPSGNALAVWYEQDGALYNIWGNSYSPKGGWGRETLLERDDAGSAREPRLAMDGSGNAIAVWEQSNGTRINIWASRHAVGSDWETPSLLETDNAGDAHTPVVSMNGGGEAFAVWHQTEGTRDQVWATRYLPVDATPPSLAVTSPLDGSTTNASSVWFTGSAEPGATVSVSGAAAAVAPDGTFGLLVPLRPGANVLVATARDGAGNVATVSVTVTFDDPVAALQEALASAQADLIAAQARTDALSASANATQAQLASAEADLGAAQSEVAVLEADANSTQSQLDAARGNLTAAQTSVSTLLASAASTQAALAASQARESALEANVTLTKADLASAQSRITALETGGGASQTGAASGQAGLAMLLAAVGIAVGAVGCALALRSKTPIVVKETVTAPAPPPPKSPPPP